MKNGHIAKVVAGKGNGIQKTQRIGNLLTNIQKLNHEKAQQIRNMQINRINEINRMNEMNRIPELSLGEKELPINNNNINIIDRVEIVKPVVLAQVVSKPVVKLVVSEQVVSEPVVLAQVISEPVVTEAKPKSLIGKIFKANKDRHQKKVTISDSV